MMKVVEGRLSEYYNHFRDCRLLSCESTDTRLMGVLALRVTWADAENPDEHFVQLMHLDYSEYGIDDYFEFDCTHYARNRDENVLEAERIWNGFLSVMGGKVVMLPPEAMMSVIDEACRIARRKTPREYDSEENVEFREASMDRLALMREAIEEGNYCRNTYSDEQIMGMVCPRELATCETINYFLMRLVDLDYHAAGYLSTIPEEELRSCVLTGQGMQTLVKNQIKQSRDPGDVPSDGFSHPYQCRMTTMGYSCYYYSTLVVYLDKDYRNKNCKVTEIGVGSVNKLSDYEAAIQLSQPEYITVFDCRDRILDHFDGNRISCLEGVEPTLVENGWLFTIYNKDNSHVNRAEYRLNDDVYGYALLSIDGEFVLMSNKLMKITDMDNSTLESIYAPFMTLVGRYQMAEPVFHTLCRTYGVMFRQLIDHMDYMD